MRDGRAERAVRGSFGIDVDPLVVAGCLREEVDLFLGDLVPVARSELALARLFELLDRQRGRHVVFITPSLIVRRPDASRRAFREAPPHLGAGRGAPAAVRQGSNARRLRTIPRLASR